MKNIKIYSLLDMLNDLVQDKSPEYSIVSIRDPDVNNTNVKDKEYENLDRLSIVRKRKMHVEYFLDITPFMGLKQYLPKKEQIENILNSCKDGENIIVHCSAGISRSSATAYLIACTDRSPTEALKILNYLLHFPNWYIVQLGAEILNDKTIETVYGDWLAENREKIDKYAPTF